MKSDSQVAKELRELAGQVLELVVLNAGGDLGRGQNWEFFVKAIPGGYNLRELAQECYKAMPEDQKRQFRGYVNRRQSGNETGNGGLKGDDS